jgi:hypothetical protein
MDPDLPAVAAPEDNTKLPELPAAAVPDDRVNAPESPLVVVSPEVIAIVPVCDVG